MLVTFLQTMSAGRGMSEQERIEYHQNQEALRNENTNTPRQAGAVRILTSSVVENGNSMIFSGMSAQDATEYRQNQQALRNEIDNVHTGGIRILTSAPAVPIGRVVVAIPAAEPGVTHENARRVVLGVCTHNEAPGPHIFMLQHDTVSRDFELPKEAVFLQIQTADVIGSDAAPAQNRCDFLGFWTRACSHALRNTGDFNLVHTTLEYGSPLHGECSRMVMVVQRELGSSPQMTMNFCSSNRHMLNLQNISVVVKNAGGGEESFAWDGTGVRGSSHFVVDEDNMPTTLFSVLHEASNTIVKMQENSDARHLSLSFRLNDEECDQSHVKTSACVWEVWLNVNRAKIRILEIHMRIET